MHFFRHLTLFKAETAQGLPRSEPVDHSSFGIIHVMPPEPMTFALALIAADEQEFNAIVLVEAPHLSFPVLLISLVICQDFLGTIDVSLLNGLPIMCDGTRCRMHACVWNEKCCHVQ